MRGSRPHSRSLLVTPSELSCGQGPHPHSAPDFPQGECCSRNTGLPLVAQTMTAKLAVNVARPNIVIQEHPNRIGVVWQRAAFSAHLTGAVRGAQIKADLLVHATCVQVSRDSLPRR